MANFSRSWIVFATLIVAALVFFQRGQSNVAFAQSAPTSCSTSTSTSTSTSDSNYNSYSYAAAPASTDAPAAAALPPCPTGSESSAGSINDIAKQRFNQMIT